ncbi:MAG: relaxase/mobilization nuclease domain-containing protein, partial [Clostridia bacterium]|nr:relaxase/mobilization nuclease domain-containing protein [Clostridia bacterium]
MATTRIIAMHLNKGKTLSQCLHNRTAYAMNPEKTNEQELVKSYECDPHTIENEFLLAKRQYALLTGRCQKNDVIAYQVRQSFKPGEITPEEANRVGCEFAERFLKGKFAFIVCTHTDRAHIHNHIIWNSTSLDCKHKFRDFLRSGRAVSKL